MTERTEQARTERDDPRWDGQAAYHVLYGERLVEDLENVPGLRAEVAGIVDAFNAGDMGDVDDAERESNERRRSEGKDWERGAYWLGVHSSSGPVYVVRPRQGFPCTLVMRADEY